MIPTHLNIGGVKYQVIEEQDVMVAKDLLGENCARTSTMTLRKDQHPTRKLQTLVHEILHALVYEAGLDEKYQDHDIVNPLSNALFRFMRDNDLGWVREENE